MAIVEELGIGEANTLVERLKGQEKVYKNEIYTFVLRNFHELKDVSVTYKLLIDLEEK